MIGDDRDLPDQQYDFGRDDESVPVPDPAFDAWLRGAACAVNAPGVAPAEAMWAEIADAQSTAERANAGRIIDVSPLRRRWLMPATIAAALLLGVALDRYLTSRTPDGAGVAPTRTAVVAPRGDLYRVAAVQTLSQAEALLTAYRADSAAWATDPDAQQLSTWARDVLGSTRLLIDSPAGEDRQLRPLLSDLELVLVQIVRLSGTAVDSADRALIDHALRDRALLPRLRTAVPSGPTAGSIASDD